MNNDNFMPETTFFIDVAKKAGEIMRQAFTSHDITWKDDDSPLTEADVMINDLVIAEAKKLFPDYGVWGEEASNNPEATRCFLVDPIDGTMPFVIGAPLSSFTIAYAEDGVIKSGIVYDPFMERLYVAELGGGAYCNGEQIHVADKTNSANMFFYLGSRVATNDRTLGMVIDDLVKIGARTHSFNSSAYGLSRVAAGGSDGLMTTADPYGIAAANLILHEAGGVSSTFAGETWSTKLDKKLGYVGASSQQSLDIMLRAINGS